MATAAIEKTGEPVPADATRQLSWSGTPVNNRGDTSPDDYVRDLADPTKRLAKFEEMGKSDDAVHTALDARRQEMCSANWNLATSDETPAGREILEFVEDNIYPQLDNMLRWFAGALQYGFAAIEPVYQWSDAPVVTALARGKVVRATKRGEERIYLRKLAHIRPTAIETFGLHIDDARRGDLARVTQRVFNGRTYVRTDIPAEKLLLWSYNREGDDYWGVPPLRHCYKAWTFKTQLERLNLLSFDRFGVGVPIAEESEAGWSETERNRLAAYLKAFRSGDSSYVIHPSGGSISILSGDGKMTMSALEWVKHYNFAIAKVFLTQQTELGSTETGARAVAETFYEQLGSIVQADSEEVATLINNGLIVPLVTMNFGRQDVYPTFAPSQRVRAGTGVASVMNQLISAGVVHPRPEDEAYFRDAFEMPAVELATLKLEQGTRDAAAAAIAKEKANRPQDDPKNPADDREQLAQRRHVHQLSALAVGAPDPAVPGKTTYRTPEFTAWEHGILWPDVLGAELSLQASRLTAEVTDVLRQIDADLTRQVEKLAEGGAAALAAAVRSIVVPERLRTQLRKTMFAAAIRARTFGATSVRNEIERQLGPTGIGPQRAPAAFYALDAQNPTPDDLHVSAQVDRAVEDEIDRREQSARSGLLTVLAQAASATAALLVSIASTAVKAGLIGLSTGRTEQNVQEVVNVGFGVGRSEEARAISDASSGSGGNRSGLRDANGAPIDLVAKVASAVMDFHTCDECAKWDGAEFPMNYPEDYTGVQCPNPRCAGGIGKCRCVWIYLTSRESVPLVPASKGPEPIRRAS